MKDRISRIHLIFKTHLDIGFTDFAANVIANYFLHFIPRAIEVARALRQEGHSERFAWTTGSWLIYEYLEQASPAERKAMEEAITAGDITWHGLPFTTHSELMDSSLFKFGLSLSQMLDKRFGKRTIAAKMTDVPGHTRGIIPLLAEAGIEFLHVGVNAASTPPDVPPVFRWRAQSGEEVTVMYHKDSYGDTMVVPGMAEAIVFAHTGDNLGPQSPDQIRQIFRTVRDQFPGSMVAASTLDSFASALSKVRDDLPVMTAELGDTWIHGVGTDPKKVAQFRELSRLRREWLASGKVNSNDEQIALFSRWLLMIPEHTWGLDEKTHLADYENYDSRRFASVRSHPNFKKMEASWQEQRAYVVNAVNALGKSVLAAEATRRLKAIEPAYPDVRGFEACDDPSLEYETARFMLRLDTAHGALIGLVDKATGRDWASPANLLALVSYQSFSQEDYNRFWRQYVVNRNRADVVFWAVLDQTKPGIDAAGAESRTTLPRLKRLFRRQDRMGSRFVLVLEMPDHAAYGCPREFVMSIDLPAQDSLVRFDLQWFQKTACRLPEAIWLSFKPDAPDLKGWELEKLGAPVSPFDVIRDGNRKLHAVERIVYGDRTDRLTIESLDAPLVAPGKPSLLNFDNRQPSLRNGMHFNLYNNCWGTNFPMWYEDDARFRFILRIDARQAE